MRSYLDDDSSHYLIKEKVETIVKHITACIAKIDVSEFDFRIGKCQTIDSVRSILLLDKYHFRTYCPECSATGMGQFPICKLKWDLLRTSLTACTIDRNTFSAPFGIF